MLLGLHKIFVDINVPDAVLPSLSDAYMYCSYGIRKDKHAMKATVHKLFADMLKQRGVVLPTEEDLAARRSRALARAKEVYGPKPVMLQ